jgi:hypothetical protein
MSKSVISKAEQQFGEKVKKDRLVLKQMEVERQARAVQTARLKALRLEKEAVDQAAAEQAAAEKALAKRSRPSKARRPASPVAGEA